MVVSRRYPGSRRTRKKPRPRPRLRSISQETFRIVQATPYSWDRPHTVNTFIEKLSTELRGRGHKVAILAPSDSRTAVRESRRLIKSAADDPDLLFSSSAGVLAVGHSLPLSSTKRGRGISLPIDVSRTVERALAVEGIDFVHVHEPFAPSTASAALRHSNSLNVGSFHSPSERFLSTQVARRFVEVFFGRLDARTALSEETRKSITEYFPANYQVIDGDDKAVDRDWSAIADQFEVIFSKLASHRHSSEGNSALRSQLAKRDLIHVDLHMHTDHSYDCETSVDLLLTTAKARGLGAVAVTDHNEISGALAAREKAEGIKVIVAEEVKTANQGEVIGLFIEEKIPAGLTLEETITEIRRQGGLVYFPHPFDRFHSVPDYEHLLEILPEIDIIEVFNPRVAFSSFNQEAERFAAKYNIVAAAGSDSHVPQGLGSVRIQMRDFDGPEEFLESLRDADIVRKHKNLVYVQTLKFLQTTGRPKPARRAAKLKTRKAKRR